MGRVPPVQWLRASELIPPHGMTHPEKMAVMADDFDRRGWDTSKAPLRGYLDEDRKVQLISGTHRRMAAFVVGMRVPVVVWPSRDFVYTQWGLPGWDWIMGIGAYNEYK